VVVLKNRTAEAKRVLDSYTNEAGAQLLLDDIRSGLAAQVEPAGARSGVQPCADR